MVLHTFAENYGLRAVPLTPEAFSEYGGVISADHQSKNVASSAANYGTALKIHKVAPIINRYDTCKSGQAASANWNIFRCSAPKHLIDRDVYTAKVVERHPYSTQTFVPMGQQRDKDSYLVIVAKTDESSPQRLPDPKSLRAFVCKGNQSVTYGVGTWHAPMVVIDQLVPYIDFAVLIHENGVAEEDCQECYFEPGCKVGFGDRAKL